MVTVLKVCSTVVAAAPTGWWCLYCLVALPRAEEILWVSVVDDQPLSRIPVRGGVFLS